MVRHNATKTLRQISLEALSTMTRQGIDASSLKSFNGVKGVQNFEDRHDAIILQTTKSVVNMREFLFGQLPLQVIQELVISYFCQH